MNQGFNFLGGSFSNRNNLTAQFNLEEKFNHSILKDDFSSMTDPSIFTAIATVLLDWSSHMSFSSIEINKPIQVVATDQMPDHT